jgi:hypothetical protein
LVFTLRGSVIKYSRGEQGIFALLPQSSSAPLSSTDLTLLKYQKKAAIPFNGRKIVIGLLASLKKKVEANDEPFRILSTPRAGPLPISFWVERKARRAPQPRERKRA